MFIASLEYKCSLEAVNRHLDANVTYLEREYAKGSFVASGRKGYTVTEFIPSMTAAGFEMLLQL